MVKKEIKASVRSFYRGTVYGPNKQATQDDMTIISDFLAEYFNKRNYAFKSTLNGREILLKVELGLASCLRRLKQKRTRAIIYDDSAAIHLTKYLNAFARKAGIPILQACGLVHLAPKFGFNSLLAISFVAPLEQAQETATETRQPAPKPLAGITFSESFDKLVELLKISAHPQPPSDTQLKPYALDRVPSTGKSKAKKLAKREAKAKRALKKRTASLEQQSHVVGESTSRS